MRYVFEIDTEIGTGSQDRQASRRRVGRPARINRQLIAEAAADIGLSDLTLRAVADRLGVSITGLYHHIEDKDDLLRLAAEYSSTRVPLPEDRGQHWALWLAEWARYSRQAFVAEPGLLGQYLSGAISAEAIADKVDAMLGPMVRQGFTVQQAHLAFDLVNSVALGSALQTIRDHEAARAGRAPLAEHHRVLAQHAPDELPYLRALLAEQATGPVPTFRDRLSTVLIGIAAERGEAWEPIAAMVRAGA